MTFYFYKSRVFVAELAAKKWLQREETYFGRALDSKTQTVEIFPGVTRYLATYRYN